MCALRDRAPGGHTTSVAKLASTRKREALGRRDGDGASEGLYVVRRRDGPNDTRYSSAVAGSPRTGEAARFSRYGVTPLATYARSAASARAASPSRASQPTCTLPTGVGSTACTNR